MAARKIDGWWYADFRVLGERYRKRSPANTRAEAQRFEQELRKELALRGTLKRDDTHETDEAKVAPQFGEFAERWLEAYVAINNRASEQHQRFSVVRSSLIPALGELRIDQITSYDAEQYKAAKLKEGYSPKTINNHLMILHRCLATAAEWKKLKPEDVPHFKQLTVSPPSYRHLSRKETDELLQAMPSGVWRKLFLVAVRTGLRFSELIALEWDDVDFETNSICVRRAEVRGSVGPTKSNRIRTVYMSTDVRQELLGMERASRRIFQFHGRSISYRRAWLHLAKACRVARIQHLGWHALRHTFASQLVQLGVPIPIIKDLLGHATLQMTMRYTHPQPESLRKAVMLLETGQVWAAGGQPPPDTAFTNNRME
jgi:integrase